jgi:phosphatidylethanolamine-binding protein
MHFYSSLLAAALAVLAQAQTPPNFSPQVDVKLEVLFNSTAVNTPGQILTKTGELFYQAFC